MSTFAEHPLFSGIDEETLKAFREHLKEDNSVYEAFKQIAFKKKQQGFRHYSADALLHIARHETEERHGTGSFKVNNNFSTLYARALATKHPEFKDWFEFRKARGCKL